MTTTRAGAPVAGLRAIGRLTGFALAALVVAVAAQWLALGLGADALLSSERVADWTGRMRRPLDPGVAILVGVGIALVGLVVLVGWWFGGRRESAGAFRSARRSRTRIDRRTLAASLERRLLPLDRRVDATVVVDRRGRVALTVVTPDVSASGPAAEHRQLLEDVIAERGLPCSVRRVDVVDVRKLKSRHRVR